MTLDEVVTFRDAYFKGCDNLTIMTDENYNFDSREAFLVWDDANSCVKVFGPNKNTHFVNQPNRRIEVFVIPYDRIVWINSIPDTTKLDELLSQMAIPAEEAKRIKDRVERLEDIESFIK